MSAAAARRRKQLAARKAANDADAVQRQLDELLAQPAMDEATAYEALQLAQSQVRKKIKAMQFPEAVELCFHAAHTILDKQRAAVASQLMDLLVQVLEETHTQESQEWIDKIIQLHQAFVQACPCPSTEGKDNGSNMILPEELVRLHRAQRDWLRTALQWSDTLGTTKYGHNQIHNIMGEQCARIATLLDPLEDTEERMDLHCDAVQHYALAEEPQRLVQYLKENFPTPTEEETAAGHACPPATRDALLTRAVLLLVAVENLRDANAVVRIYLDTVEERNTQELTASYTNKEDGKAPAHAIFCAMLLRICEKDERTGPLFSWLLRSFKKELDKLYKPHVVASYTTKIGKIYFNIQPPPSMLNMMENMMGMMGGGGGPAGMGLNPAMLQQMQQMMQQM